MTEEALLDLYDPEADVTDRSRLMLDPDPSFAQRTLGFAKHGPALIADLAAEVERLRDTPPEPTPGIPRADLYQLLQHIVAVPDMANGMQNGWVFYLDPEPRDVATLARISAGEVWEGQQPNKEQP